MNYCTKKLKLANNRKSSKCSTEHDDYFTKK